MKTIVNNCNKPHHSGQGQGQERVAVGTNQEMEGRGKWEACRYPHIHLPHTAPVFVEKGGFRISPPWEGPAPRTPTRVRGPHAGGSGHLHRGGAAGTDLALPGQRCRSARPHACRRGRAAATRADGAQGAAAMPGRGAGRGRGRRGSGRGVLGAPLLPPRLGAPLCRRGRRWARGARVRSRPACPFPRVSEHACAPLPARLRCVPGVWAFFFSLFFPPYSLPSPPPPPRLLQVLLLVACKGFAPPFWNPILAAAKAV